MKTIASVLCLALLLNPALAAASSAQLKLNDKDYFDQPGLNVLVFSNWYDGLFSDSKISGVELVHHGQRTATNGDVRLSDTPEQWDPIPSFIRREVDDANQTVTAYLHYPDYGFNYAIQVSKTERGVSIAVQLDKPVPEALAGKAGFNLEFLPSAYFGTSYLMDGKPAPFPIYPTGVKENNQDIRAEALATGSQLVLAPEDPERRIMIEAQSGDVALFDGRTKAQNGWFVVRGMIPAGQNGTVLNWELEATTRNDWLRQPVIGHSQVGYHPKQQKVAVIELDARAKANGQAQLVRIDASGSRTVVKSAQPQNWGQYTRYQYVTFDFSDITQPGLYQLEYQGTTTASFSISEEVYNSAWYATLDHYFPVQMDHVLVNEAYRVWHGASHLDDALQAPVDHEHFDLYAQGPTTDTDFKPGEHIPGLNVGGWYDAGDYDIRTQTQYRTVQNLVQVWEEFGLTRDTTLVDYEAKYVDIHVPDGKPDLLQQIEHGTLALQAQFDAVGHAIPGIIVPDISQYTHLGDGLTMTDNLIYKPGMGENESDGFHSGKMDDRWAFTSKSSALNYGSIAALAAASRALADHNPTLAEAALKTAQQVWQQEQGKEPDVFRHGNTTGGRLEAEHLKAAVELLVTSGEAQYKQAVQQLMPEIEQNFAQSAILAVRAMPLMPDSFASRIEALAGEYRTELNALQTQNPYGVLITEGGWAGNGTILQMAMAHYYLHKAFPDLFDEEGVYQALNYLYGTHPDSDISFVSNVGTESKQVAYGMNRADFSFISGAIVPGVLILKPDLPENKEDWPFLWGQNEYVINVGASYLFVVNAAKALLDKSD